MDDPRDLSVTVILKSGAQVRMRMSRAGFDELRNLLLEIARQREPLFAPLAGGAVDIQGIAAITSEVDSDVVALRRLAKKWQLSHSDAARRAIREVAEREGVLDGAE